MHAQQKTTLIEMPEWKKRLLTFLHVTEKPTNMHEFFLPSFNLKCQNARNLLRIYKRRRGNSVDRQQQQHHKISIESFFFFSTENRIRNKKKLLKHVVMSISTYAHIDFDAKIRCGVALNCIFVGRQCFQLAACNLGIKMG